MSEKERERERESRKEKERTPYLELLECGEDECEGGDKDDAKACEGKHLHKEVSMWKLLHIHRENMIPRLVKAYTNTQDNTKDSEGKHMHTRRYQGL